MYKIEYFGSVRNSFAHAGPHASSSVGLFVVSTNMWAGVLGGCAPLPQRMLRIDNVRLSGYPLPDNPGGHDWAALALVFARASR